MTGSQLLIVLFVALIAWGTLESYRHRQNLKRIPIRIHVNGTRGKSSVTRLIAAALREAGLVTCAKTTGTLARMILPDAREVPIFRPAGANVIEQARIVGARRVPSGHQDRKLGTVAQIPIALSGERRQILQQRRVYGLDGECRDQADQGVNAQRSDVIAARFDEDVLAPKPAVVVIIAGVNDVYQGRPAQHVKEQLAAMYRRAQDAGIKVIAGSIIPYNTATPDQNARMHEINDWIRGQAQADPRILFVDTRAAVAAPGQPDTLISSPDGLHPDVDGYKRMADVIAPVIQRALLK